MNKYLSRLLCSALDFDIACNKYCFLNLTCGTCTMYVTLSKIHCIPMPYLCKYNYYC